MCKHSLIFGTGGIIEARTMRPTPLDRLPQLVVHVQIGYVADELVESVKIIYELAVKLDLLSKVLYN